jgi:hypothetical protein
VCTFRPVTRSGHRMVIGQSIAPRAFAVILGGPLQRSVLPDMHYPPKRYANCSDDPAGAAPFFQPNPSFAAH